MIHNLTIENVSRCLILGHNHSKPELKKHSMRFIAENGDQVIKDAEWKKVIERGVFLSFFLFSRDEATLYEGVSVGRSVRPSDGP